MYGLLGFKVLTDINYRHNSKNSIKRIQNIILETQKEENVIPEVGAISDKNNQSRSLKFDKKKEEIYNFANLNPAKFVGHGGTTRYIPQKSQQKSQEEEQHDETQKKGIRRKKKAQQQIKTYEGGGETAPTYIDVKKNEIINLYNTGYNSVATHSKEYAQYFINMQKKIEKYHQEFFPVYQYYQGLLRSGEVIIEYRLDQKGVINNAKIVGSYGSEVVDNASLNSIVYAKSFGALPKDLAGKEDITIRFHFIYMER